MNAPKGQKYCTTCDTPIDDAQTYCSDSCARVSEQTDTISDLKSQLRSLAAPQPCGHSAADTVDGVCRACLQQREAVEASRREAFEESANLLNDLSKFEWKAMNYTGEAALDAASVIIRSRAATQPDARGAAVKSSLESTDCS